MKFRALLTLCAFAPTAVLLVGISSAQQGEAPPSPDGNSLLAVSPDEPVGKPLPYGRPLSRADAKSRQSGRAGVQPPATADDGPPRTLAVLTNALRQIGKLRRPIGNEGVGPGQVPGEPPDSLPAPSEAPYLKDLAAWLSVPIPKDATSGDIEFAIKQAISESVRYSDEVLTDEAVMECRDAIPTTKDTKTFEAYHAFIKKIAGKKIIILDN